MPTNDTSTGRSADNLNAGRAFEQFPKAQVGLIGLQALPVFPVSKKAGKIPVIKRDSFTRRSDAKRQDGAAFARGTYQTTEVSYQCEQYGYESPVSKGQRAVFANDFDADEYARALIESKLRLEQEYRIAAALFDVSSTGWYSSTAALCTDVSTDWDNIASTIISDVEGAKAYVRKNCGLDPNTMIISAAHLKSLRTNTGLLGAFPGVPVVSEAVMLQALPAILGIPKILIGSAVYNSANEGQTFSGGYLGSDDYCWIGVTADSSDLVTPCVGRTLQWDAFGASGIEWDFYTEKQTKSDIWQGEHAVDELIADLYFGHVLIIDT
jgi:hypothetical protein